MRDWLEAELTEHLAPIKAPDALWNRIEGAPAAVVPLGFRLRAVPIAAVVTLILAGALWFMARGEGRRTPYRQFANTTARAESCLLCHTTL